MALGLNPAIFPVCFLSGFVCVYVYMYFITCKLTMHPFLSGWTLNGLCKHLHNILILLLDLQIYLLHKIYSRRTSLPISFLFYLYFLLNPVLNCWYVVAGN